MSKKKILFILMVPIAVVLVSIGMLRNVRKAELSQYNASITQTPEKTLWQTYVNQDLGIEFTYPNYEDETPVWTMKEGQNGRLFTGGITLPSGARINFYASTQEYTEPKKGVWVGTEGFTKQGGKYFSIRNGEVSEISIKYHEIWKLDDGSEALVAYGRDYDPTADYPEAAALVWINIPNNPDFTGIGFEITHMTPQGPRPATLEDLNTLKQIVSSIKSLN